MLGGTLTASRKKTLDVTAWYHTRVRCFTQDIIDEMRKEQCYQRAQGEQMQFTSLSDSLYRFRWQIAQPPGSVESITREEHHTRTGITSSVICRKMIPIPSNINADSKLLPSLLCPIRVAWVSRGRIHCPSIITLQLLDFEIN